MTTSDGAVGASRKLIDHGANNRRFNLVVMGDGYQAAQLAQFTTDAQRTITTFLSTPPFDVVRTAINAWTVDVTSTESGADIPCDTPPTARRTYFDAAYCLNGLRRLIGVNYATATTVARSVINVNQSGLVLVNHPEYGGSGNPGTAVASVHANALRVALHEMGHSFYDLADEYLENLPGDPHGNYWAGRDNVTRDKDAAGKPVVKWPDLVLPSTPLPTTTNSACTTAFDNAASPVAAGTVGAFEGGARFNCAVWRPEHRCIMGKDLNQPFCSVCRRRIIATFARFVHRPEEIHRETWTLGWTTIAPFALGGQPHFLSYKAAQGSVSIDRLRPDASGFDNTMGSTWSAGWTTLLPIATPAGQFLVLYKAATGQAEIDRISADGQNVDTVTPLSWTTGWTHMAAFTLGGQPHVLSYKTATGSVSIDRFLPDGSGFVTTMGSTWSLGWTTLLPIAVGGRQLLLTYKAGTGEMQLSEITPDGQNVNTLSSHQWSPGWTAFCPFTVDGDAFYVAYKAGDGLMSVDRVRPDGSNVDTLLFRTWGTGWGIFAPFTLGGVPHELVYRPTDGAGAIDRIW